MSTDQFELDSIDQGGMLMVEPVNELMEAMANEPAPSPLYEHLWFEGEVACLFANSNLGKSIFAVQIAEAIAADQPVLYLDCELSRKQFYSRYSSPDTGRRHRFPDSLYRVDIRPERLGCGNIEDSILADLEKIAVSKEIKVLIIDNLTYVCASSEKGDEAGRFMMKLKRLQMNYGWSILVIAHTPKVKDGKITENHLAGSKKLFNFFDTVFALGKSREGYGYRYLKQLKVRSREFTLTEENVAVYKLTKAEDGRLFLDFRKYDKEYRQLGICSSPNQELINQVVELRDAGMSFRNMETELGVPKSTLNRIHLQYIRNSTSTDGNEDVSLCGSTEGDEEEDDGHG